MYEDDVDDFLELCCEWIFKLRWFTVTHDHFMTATCIIRFMTQAEWHFDSCRANDRLITVTDLCVKGEMGRRSPWIIKFLRKMTCRRSELFLWGESLDRRNNCRHERSKFLYILTSNKFELVWFSLYYFKIISYMPTCKVLGCKFLKCMFWGKISAQGNLNIRKYKF